MGEIDNAHDPEDQCQAQADNGVGAVQQQSVAEQLYEDIHGTTLSNKKKQSIRKDARVFKNSDRYYWLETGLPKERHRSEERREGKGCISTCASRWSRYHKDKNTKKKKSRKSSETKQ